jgi:hypothetical protein
MKQNEKRTCRCGEKKELGIMEVEGKDPPRVLMFLSGLSSP